MLGHFISRRAIKFGVLALLGLGWTLSAPQSSYACGGHCQASRMCDATVRAKKPPKGQGHAEYQKCMMDPQNYK